MVKPPSKKQRHWLDPPDWWKKWKPLRWLAAIFIVVGATSGLWSGIKLVLDPGAHPQTQDYLATQSFRVRLIDSFDSFDSVDNVSAALGAAGYTWTRQKNHRQPDPDFPPRDLDTLEVEGFKHLGFTGALTLKFFNDRLYEAEYVPQAKTLDAYAAALNKAETRFKRDRVGKVEFNDNTLRIASNVDLARSAVGQSLHTTPYVLWQDLRLIRQRNQWDHDFGSIPYKAKP